MKDLIILSLYNGYFLLICMRFCVVQSIECHIIDVFRKKVTGEILIRQIPLSKNSSYTSDIGYSSTNHVVELTSTSIVFFYE